jgi:uncharacterized lipoprotein YddW (UPF0748 family)
MGLLALLGACLLSCTHQPAPTVASEPRGLWVLCEGSQQVLEHPERLDVLLADAQALGVTDLFVQVYRSGRAWFASTQADPTPYQAVFRKDGRDALQILITRAHAQGLRVHAWVNLLTLNHNDQAPILRDLGRQAAVVDQKGRSVLDYPDYEIPPPDRGWLRMGTPGIWLDPAAPGVADRLAATLVELVKRYPGLDGLHFDYVRYADVLPFSPGTRFGVGLGFGYGAPSRALFQEQTGLVAPFGSSLVNANAWDDWRRGRLTALVKEIAQRSRAARPGLQISAAVIPDPDRAYRVDLQDWPGWLDAGILDFAVPMLYTRDERIFGYELDALAGMARSRRIWVGVGAYLFADDPSQAVAQLRRVTAEQDLGASIFSWDSIRESPALLSALATEVARDGTTGPR